MTTVRADDLNRAIELHRKGDLPAAIRAYEKFLQEAPQHPSALNLLGLAYSQTGESVRAVPMLQRALALRPDLPGVNYNLGTMLSGLGRYEDAVLHFRKAVEADPADVEALNSLGSGLNSLGRTDEAAACFERAIALRPNYAPAHHNLAKLWFAAKKFEQAAAHYKSAMANDPGMMSAQLGLGIALRHLGRRDEAIEVYARAVERWPASSEAHSDFGAALDEAERFDEAIEQQQRALALDPRYALAHFWLGSTYYAQNRYELALVHYQRASILGLPPDPEVHAKLAINWCLYYRGEFHGALAGIDAVIAEDGGRHPEVMKEKGLMCFSRGDFAVGWPLYEYRPGIGAGISREQKTPRWKGEAVDGTLLVWGEQGLGDQILHASMIDDLRARADSILLEVEPRLVDLFARSFPGVTVVPFDSPLPEERIAAQIPIGSLGGLFRLDWASFPKRERRYLTADPARTAALRERLAAGGRKVVGLSWRSVRQRLGAHKSARLADFTPILKLPGVNFVDLQYGDTTDERATFERDTGISVMRLGDIDTTNDLDGLAALMTACDVVVSVSNTNAHLAGALGRPTWVFAPSGFSQFWYWFPQMGKSPWYPQVEVRQRSANRPWASVIAPTAIEIEAFLRKSRSSG
jgi:tetratricopeptide (TPR) repeat protein